MLWNYLKFIVGCLIISFLLGIVFGYFGLKGSALYGIVMGILMISNMCLIVAVLPLVIIFYFIDKINKK